MLVALENKPLRWIRMIALGLKSKVSYFPFSLLPISGLWQGCSNENSRRSLNFLTAVSAVLLLTKQTRMNLCSSTVLEYRLFYAEVLSYMCVLFVFQKLPTNPESPCLATTSYFCVSPTS